MNCSVVFILVVANLLLSSVQARREKVRKYVWLQEFRNCREEPGKTHINGSFTHQGGGTFQGNVEGFVPYTLEHLYLFIEVKKCPSMLQTDYCEVVMSFPGGDQCDGKESFFEDLFKQADPPLSCPVLGKYEARNAILDTDKYMQFFRGLGDEEWLHAYLHVYSDEKRLNEEICIVLIATQKKFPVLKGGNRKRKP